MKIMLVWTVVVVIVSLTSCQSAVQPVTKKPVVNANDIVLAENAKARATIVVSKDLMPDAAAIAKPKPMKGRFVRLTHPSDRVMVAEVEVFSKGVNVAKGKPATQLGAWNPFYGPERAVDGNKDPVGAFDNTNSQVSTDELGSWWEVDLGKMVDIDKIVVWNIAPPNEKRQQGMNVLVLDEKRKGVAVFTVSNYDDHWVFDSLSHPPRGEARNLYTVQALKDLRHYLNVVTGTDFPIAREGAQKPGQTYIYVGQAASRKLGIDPTNLSDDEWIVRTSGRNLFLLGGKRFGDSIAVYHFLEDIVEVHWWSQWEEEVPSKPTLAVSATNLQKTPAFKGRTLRTWAGYDTHDMRQRLMPFTEGILSTVGVGNGSMLNLLSRYEGDQMQKHPEWFAKNSDGSIAGLDYGLKVGMHRDLCYTHVTDETVDIISRSIIRAIREYEEQLKLAGSELPASPVIGFDRDDAPHACKCPDCLALKGPFSDRWVAFVNRISEKVRKSYPQLTIMIYGYLDNTNPPQTTKMADNLVVKYCMVGELSDRSLLDPANASTLDLIKGWGDKGPVSIWHYETNAQLCKGVSDTGGRNGKEAGLAGAYQMPRPLYYGDLFRNLHQNKVTNFFSEIDSQTVRDLGELRNWVMAKLLEDPYQDETKLVDSFLNGFYGPGAPYIREYLAFVKEKAAKFPPSYFNWTSANRIEYLDQEFFVKTQTIFDKGNHAFEKVKNGKIYRRRFDRAWMSATVPFLAKWTLTANEWVASGKRIEDYPLNHDAILKKYKAVYRDNMLLTNGSIDEQWLANHFKVIGAKYVTEPLPEMFKGISREGLYDFPVATGEFLLSPKVKVEKDSFAGGREVLMVRELNDGKGSTSAPLKELFPIRFYNNSGLVPPVREISDMKEIKPNEYAWYYAGHYDGQPYGWRGNCLDLFSVWDIGYGAEGLITLGAADFKMWPYDAWVEMKVSTEGGKVTEIRVARVILLTGNAIKSFKESVRQIPELKPPTITMDAPMQGRYVRLSHPSDCVMVAEVGVFSGGKNIAKDKPAKQSGTWRTNFDANRAVDGDPNPNTLMTDENSQISTDPNGWWEVDLGKMASIDQIVIWNIAAPNDARQVGMQVELLDENRKPVNTFQVKQVSSYWTFTSISGK